MAFHNRKVRVLVAAGSVMAMAAGAGAQVFDAQAALAAAQDTVPNPNGVFSYGVYTGGLDPATFSTLPFDEDIANGLDAFRPSEQALDPNFIFNDTGATQSVANFTLQPNEIGLNPFGGPIVLRFTAPAAGQYSVDASFVGIQTVNADAEAFVFQNNAEQFQAEATSAGASYLSTLTLAAGDTVDFLAAGSNTDAAFGNRTTRLEATLTVVPEPAAAGLIALAASGLLARRRRSI